MNRNFFKTNWFYIAMGLVLAIYGIRKYPWLNPFLHSGKNVPEGKMTESGGVKKGAALLGFVPEAEAKIAQEDSRISDAKAEAFLKRFAQVALSEKKKFGAPASVILACAYANSKAGSQEAATSANNFFALPCTDDWEGETQSIDGKCMRKYESAWASFRDFSIFLSSQEWFGSLKKSAGKDWKAWTEKLGEENIADTRTMRSVIEQFHLQELDGI